MGACQSCEDWLVLQGVQSESVTTTATQLGMLDLEFEINKVRSERRMLTRVPNELSQIQAHSLFRLA